MLKISPQKGDKVEQTWVIKQAVHENETEGIFGASGMIEEFDIVGFLTTRNET